jgi:hypothetical protein
MMISPFYDFLLYIAVVYFLSVFQNRTYEEKYPICRISSPGTRIQQALSFSLLVVPAIQVLNNDDYDDDNDDDDEEEEEDGW